MLWNQLQNFQMYENTLTSTKDPGQLYINLKLRGRQRCKERGLSYVDLPDLHITHVSYILQVGSKHY